MAMVYSYIRFSSKPQEQGDSVRRQVGLGDKWMKRHPEHTLDTTLRLRDLGVSAFRGKNLDKDKGDLGKFIALAKQEHSPIAPGSILMLESLDRFSRQPPRKAYAAFCALVEAGVSVLTLDPEQLIDERNIDDMASTLTIIIKMQLGYEASRDKSRWLSQAWEGKRKRAMEDNTPMTTRCPAWLYWDEKAGAWAAQEGAKETLEYIFKRTCEGIGRQRLLAELQGRFKTFGKAKRWNGTMLSSILKDRMVLGELTPLRKSSKRQPPIVGYYPRMIEDEVFYRARGGIESRKHATGRHTQFVNLFVGLVRFPDGHQGQIQTATWASGNGGHIARRFVSSGHRERVAGACPLSLDYSKVERYVMPCIYQLKAPNILHTTTSPDDTLSLKRELAGMVARYAELEKELTGGRKPVPELLKAIDVVSGAMDGIRQKIDHLEAQNATARAKPVESIHETLRTIAAKPEEDRHDLRLRLRGLIADVVERIEIDPYATKCKTGGRAVEARLMVVFKSGGYIGVDTADGHITKSDMTTIKALDALQIAMPKRLQASKGKSPTKAK